MPSDYIAKFIFWHQADVDLLHNWNSLP